MWLMWLMTCGCNACWYIAATIDLTVTLTACLIEPKGSADSLIVWTVRQQIFNILKLCDSFEIWLNSFLFLVTPVCLFVHFYVQ